MPMKPKQPPRFVPMVDYLQPRTSGKVTVDHYEVSQTESQFSAFRRGQYCPAGKYVRLIINGTLYMSDTRMEHNTNYAALNRSHGRVLIAGLGIGMLLVPMLQKEEVQHITVVEKSKDVIAVIEPQLRECKKLSNVIDKLTVVEGDIYEWTPPKGEKYDTIYFDIWADQSTDCLKDMERLHRKFAARLNRSNPDRWMESWRRDELKSQKRSEARTGSWWS